MQAGFYVVAASSLRLRGGLVLRNAPFFEGSARNLLAEVLQRPLTDEMY